MSAKYIKCEKCGLNYRREGEEMCIVCEEKEFMNDKKIMLSSGSVFSFSLRRGVSPESLSCIRELKVFRGNEYILAYDSNAECAGVVFKHDEPKALAHNQAEICFFDKYFEKYGKWHRIFSDYSKDIRLLYDDLQNILNSQDKYIYSGYFRKR